MRFEYQAERCNPTKWSLFIARLANTVPVAQGSVDVLLTTAERPHNVLRFTTQDNALAVDAVDKLVEMLREETFPTGRLTRILPKS